MLNKQLELTMQLATLKDVAKEYQGKTIDNIIQQMEARLAEVINQETI